MAKMECELRGSLNEVLEAVHNALLSSVSLSMEDSSTFVTPHSRCVVRVYERYSWSGGNRVSLNLTLLETDGRLFLSAITSGGSQATFFKINTWGEEAFLETITDTVSQYVIG